MTKIFVPQQSTRIGIHVKSVTLVFIFTIIFLIIIILNTIGEEQYGELGPKELIRKIKIDDPNKLVIGHLNINSIRYKFECLCDIVANNIDILLISETKLNDSFPNGQFLMNGFQVPFRKDRTDKGGGLLLFMQEQIPCRELNITFEHKIEAIFVEINLKKRKWLLICGYNPVKNEISIFLNCIESKLNELCLKYENIILMVDLNSEISEESMENF